MISGSKLQLPARLKKILLASEFAFLFFGIPMFMYFDTGFKLPSSLLIPVLVIIFVILRFRTDFRWKDLIYLRISKKNMKRDAIIILASAACLIIILMLVHPEKLLNLPRGNTMIWIALGAFYPLFSAYPQEILFRTYIFKRYHRIFPKEWMKITASGVTFSFVHILYYHPLSMLLSLVGGIYLASAYQRTGSVLYAAILHGILGMLVFTIGFGEYFWLDMYEYF